MKLTPKLITLFCIVLFTTTTPAAKSAEQLYQRGDYKAALNLYQQTEHPNRATLYAMGACAYHLKNYSLAVAYWRKAQQSAGLRMHAAIDAGMTKIYAQIGREYQVSWLEKIKRMVAMIPLLFLQLLVIAIILLQFLYADYFSKRRALLITMRVVLILVFLGIYQLQEEPIGVVRASTEVRAGPGTDYPVVGELSLIDEVKVEDKEDTWYKIKHSKKLKGWVEKNFIDLI